MVTSLAKAFSVLVFVLSVGFLGGVLVVRSGSYPWSQYFRAPQLADYSFQEVASGETTKVDVKLRAPVPGEQGFQKTVDLEPQAIVEAAKDRVARLQARGRALKDRLATIQQERSDYERVVIANNTALDSHANLVAEQLADLNKSLRNLDSRSIELAEQIAAVNSDESARREDLARLRVQYEQAKAEYERAVEQRVELEDALLRLTGTETLMAARKKMLENQLYDADGSGDAGDSDSP